MALKTYSITIIKFFINNISNIVKKKLKSWSIIRLLGVASETRVKEITNCQFNLWVVDLEIEKENEPSES